MIYCNYQQYVNTYFDKDKCCRCCHICTTPCWLNATHHHISSSMRHASDPIYLKFLNIIGCRQPIQIEIDMFYGIA